MYPLELPSKQPISQYRQLKFLVDPNEKERLEAQGYAFAPAKKYDYTYFDLPIYSDKLENLRLISGECGHVLDLRHFDPKRALWAKKICRVKDPSSVSDMLSMMGFNIAGCFEKVSSICQNGDFDLKFVVVDCVLAFVEIKTSAADVDLMSHRIRVLGYDKSAAEVGTTLHLMRAAQKRKVQ
jgi:adenylate cyclase class IV